jgi:hypothetical protein
MGLAGIPISLSSKSPALGGTSTAGEQLKNPCGCTMISTLSTEIQYQFDIKQANNN